MMPGNVLKVSGRTQEVYRSPEDSKYHIRELKMSSFSRSLKLPDWVKMDPEASLNDGLLILKWEMPEDEKVEQPRLIEVKKS